MIWFFFAGFAGLAVVGVATWARGERKKAEAEAAARKENARQQAETARLLAKLKDYDG
jgi:hypothetical protein